MITAEARPKLVGEAVTLAKLFHEHLSIFGGQSTTFVGLQENS